MYNPIGGYSRNQFVGRGYFHNLIITGIGSQRGIQAAFLNMNPFHAQNTRRFNRDGFNPQNAHVIQGAGNNDLRAKHFSYRLRGFVTDVS